MPQSDVRPLGFFFAKGRKVEKKSQRNVKSSLSIKLDSWTEALPLHSLLSFFSELPKSNAVVPSLLNIAVCNHHYERDGRFPS